MNAPLSSSPRPGQILQILILEVNILGLVPLRVIESKLATVKLLLEEYTDRGNTYCEPHQEPGHTHKTGYL